MQIFDGPLRRPIRASGRLDLEDTLRLREKLFMYAAKYLVTVVFVFKIVTYFNEIVKTSIVHLLEQHLTQWEISRFAFLPAVISN